jgi:hypothetical protein
MEAARRRDVAGPNTLPPPPRPSLLRRFAVQFTDLFAVVLLAAAAISFLAYVVAVPHEPGNAQLALAILGVVGLNAGIGFVQEYSAERTGATDTVGLLRLNNAGVNLIETTIGPRSRAAQHTLGGVPLPGGCVVAAVMRAGVPVVPDASYLLREGDEVLVVAQTATEAEVRDAFQ